MRFQEVAQVYERIASTTKRLEIREILSGILPRVPPSEIDKLLYMLQGQLRPEYEGVELGLGDSLLRRTISLATGASEGDIRRAEHRTGDLGTTVFELVSARSTKGGPPSPDPLELGEVYDTMMRIATERGVGSQEAKVGIFADLLRKADPLEAKHLVRFALGKTRLGVREMSVLDALAAAFGGPDIKAARVRLEEAYNVCPDLGEIGRIVREDGLRGLDKVGIRLGRPIRPMLAEREPTLEAVLARMPQGAAFEYKYDGLRIQAHVHKTRDVRLFSRRLEEIGSQFPEIVQDLAACLSHLPAIVEGECVPVDPDTGELRPFQEISRRRGRKYDLERFRQEVPVRYLLFDVLCIGEESLLKVPYPERRRRLEELVRPDERVDLATREVVGDLSGAERFFQRSLADGCEGIMAKSLAPESIYRAGSRGFLWIKYKREYTHELADTIDGVIVGAFWGRGRRGGRFGAFLVALRDEENDSFPTLCKVGSGFDDATLEELTKRLRPRALPGPAPGVESHLTPDVWLPPEVVLELRGAELSLSPVHRAGFGRLREGYGLALRFPRFTGRIREDKNPEEATTVTEALELYRMQVRKISSRAGTDTEETSAP
jgi:DNA ligase-1